MSFHFIYKFKSSHSSSYTHTQFAVVGDTNLPLTNQSMMLEVSMAADYDHTYQQILSTPLSFSSTLNHNNDSNLPLTIEMCEVAKPLVPFDSRH